jgi:hypothetical protein
MYILAKKLIKIQITVLRKLEKLKITLFIQTGRCNKTNNATNDTEINN